MKSTGIGDMTLATAIARDVIADFPEARVVIFAGKSALDRMLGGQIADLFVVRQYLDAQRGGKA